MLQKIFKKDYWWLTLPLNFFISKHFLHTLFSFFWCVISLVFLFYCLHFNFIFWFIWLFVVAVFGFAFALFNILSFFFRFQYLWHDLQKFVCYVFVEVTQNYFSVLHMFFVIVDKLFDCFDAGYSEACQWKLKYFCWDCRNWYRLVVIFDI